MDCRRIKEYIYPFLDGELDNQTNLLVEEHLSSCLLCRLELEQEKKINSLIKNNIPKDKASYELKETIFNKLENLEEKNVIPSAPPFLKPVFVIMITVFLTTILFSSFLVNIHKPFPVFSESVKEHIRFLQGHLSINITTPKPEEALNWLQTKLDFKAMVPDLSSYGVNLLGARICNLKDKKAAYIIYKKNEHILSVFMFDAKDLKFPKAKKLAVNNKIFYLDKEKGYNSALWIDEGIACVFVSSLGEAELLHLASL